MIELLLIRSASYFNKNLLSLIPGSIHSFDFESPIYPASSIKDQPHLII